MTFGSRVQKKTKKTNLFVKEVGWNFSYCKQCHQNLSQIDTFQSKILSCNACHNCLNATIVNVIVYCTLCATRVSILHLL